MSPHLDDAVMSMGGWIAANAWWQDVRIVTALAGIPPTWSWPSPFDSASGFRDSATAVSRRRDEDTDATAVLGVKPQHLDFLDGQYGLDVDEAAMAAALLEEFHHAEQAAVPLGLAHPDHRLVARACRQAMQCCPRQRFLVYADLPSDVLYRAHVAGAVRGWYRKGWALTPVEWPIDLDVKARARECYKSQVRFPELALENLTKEHGWIATRVEV